MINPDDIIIGRKSQYLNFPPYDMGFLQALKTYSEDSRWIVPVWDHSTAPAWKSALPSWPLKHTQSCGTDGLRGVASMAVAWLPAGGAGHAAGSARGRARPRAISAPVTNRRPDTASHHPGGVSFTHLTGWQ